MVLNQLARTLNQLKSNVDKIIEKDIDISKPFDFTKTLYDFKERKNSYIVTSFENNLKELQRLAVNLLQAHQHDEIKFSEIKHIMDLIKQIKSYKNENTKENKTDEIKNCIDKIGHVVASLNIDAATPASSTNTARNNLETRFRINFNLDKLPDEIKSELQADLEELQKCYYSNCYRSSVIICGRILEMALHRKYFEVTGFDILEKNPGIGLGNLIAKLRDKNVELDPGLTQQVHLINQVRIFSVHKKKTAFYPTKPQTQAIILYTVDILNKMF